MQIRRIHISGHKCLVDVDIAFQTEDNGSSTILIGENGSGKSTLLETILEILMSFSVPSIAGKKDYDYELEYIYAQKVIRISRWSNIYTVTENGNVISHGRFSDVRKAVNRIPNRIIPRRIISFYCGANKTITQLSKKYEDGFRKNCMNNIVLFRNYQMHGRAERIDTFQDQRFTYCHEELVEAYLCALLCARDSKEKEALRKTCEITGIRRIGIELNIKKISKLYGQQVIRNEQLDYLFDVLNYIDNSFTELFSHARHTVSKNKVFFDLEDLGQYDLDSVTILNFFEKLQLLFNAKMIVTLIHRGQEVRSNDLSEGQRQIIKVLGMLSACRSEDTLVLMDEPDAHMNPKWKYDLKSIIDDCLRHETTNTQALIATHDPLVINGVDKRFIRLFELERRNNENVTKVITPTEDTVGLGIDGLLQSEYYGLPSTLDIETQRKLDKKRDLLIKRKEGTITPEEKEELHRLSDEIDDLAFTRNIPTDNYYDDFVAAMHQFYRKRPHVTLSPEEIRQRNEKTREIVEDLLRDAVH